MRSERERTPEGQEYGTPAGIEATVDSILSKIDKESIGTPEGIERTLKLIEQRVAESARLAQDKKPDAEERAKEAVEIMRAISKHIDQIMIDTLKRESDTLPELGITTETRLIEISREAEDIYADILNTAIRTFEDLPPEEHERASDVILLLDKHIEEQQGYRRKLEDEKTKRLMKSAKDLMAVLKRERGGR